MNDALTGEVKYYFKSPITLSDSKAVLSRRIGKFPASQAKAQSVIIF